MHETNFKKPRQTAAARQQGLRDRHGWRTAAKRNKFGDPTKAGEKAAAKRHENAVKAETRGKVLVRSSVCECCGDVEMVTAQKWWKAEHEAHEVVPRSLTRGLAPEYRFSTENTARLCCQCHRWIQDKVLVFEFLSDVRMDGPFTIAPGPNARGRTLAMLGVSTTRGR